VMGATDCSYIPGGVADGRGTQGGNLQQGVKVGGSDHSARPRGVPRTSTRYGEASKREKVTGEVNLDAPF
jgi:hypothetical protein